MKKRDRQSDKQAERKTQRQTKKATEILPVTQSNKDYDSRQTEGLTSSNLSLWLLGKKESFKCSFCLIAGANCMNVLYLVSTQELTET